MGFPPASRQPMGGGAPSPAMSGGAPQSGMGGGEPMDFGASLEQLRSELPPEAQSKIDPSNPLTQLMYKRLRDGINEEEGQALLLLIDQAEAVAPGSLRALKKVLPEIYLLLDFFDDGELNDSVGEGGDMGGGAPPMASAGGPPPSRPSPPRPSYESDDDDEDDYTGSAASRLSSIRA